jgi:hypothetical protein
MSYTGTLCTEAEIALMAGENVDATGDTEANRNLLVAQAESYVVTLSRYDWVGNFGSLTANAKQILAEYCSRYVAMSLISYNMSGYTTRVEAEDMINIHAWRMVILENILRDQMFVTYVKGG